MLFQDVLLYVAFSLQGSSSEFNFQMMLLFDQSLMLILPAMLPLMFVLDIFFASL